ncbi:hypothetical protein LOTGIDRAFT_172426, partial [Lottia gigantea]
LPKDQDCHELWCKNRKKLIREAQKRGDDSYVKSVSRSASVGSTQSKSYSSQSSRDASYSRNVSIDMQDANNAAVKNQLAQLMPLLENHSSLSVAQLAKKLDVNIDPTTSQLLDNLKNQLMTNKTQTLPSGGDGFGGYSSNGNYNTSGASASHGQPYTDQNQDKNAGVKAALAQLLTKQGMDVTMSGNQYQANTDTASGGKSAPAVTARQYSQDSRSSLDRPYSDNSIQGSVQRSMSSEDSNDGLKYGRPPQPLVSKSSGAKKAGGRGHGEQYQGRDRRSGGYEGEHSRGGKGGADHSGGSGKKWR